MIWVFMSRQTRARFLIFSYVANCIDLFIPVAIPESDMLFNHAKSLQLAGNKGYTNWPGTHLFKWPESWMIYSLLLFYLLFYLFILFIILLFISINCGKQSERLQVSVSCSQVVSESGCITTDCRYRLYFDDR